MQELECDDCDSMAAIPRRVYIDGTSVWTMDLCNECWIKVDKITMLSEWISNFVKFPSLTDRL